MPISKSAKLTSKKPLYKEKIKTDTGYVWRYDEKALKERAKEKHGKLKHLEKSIEKLRKAYEKDLSSDDLRTRAIAAVVGIIDDTAMRIGNEPSAKEGTYGASTLKKKHITFSGPKAKFNFVGKDGVKQHQETSNAKVIKVIKELMKDKKSDDFVFEVDGKKIWDRAINRYLLPFKISAKDIRGFHANRLMKEKLKKKDFEDALEEVAGIVGHEPATLKNQYLDPDLVKKHIKQAQNMLLNPSLNVSNVASHTVLTPTLTTAWKMIAPFLPSGARVISGYRGRSRQEIIISRYWNQRYWKYPGGRMQTGNVGDGFFIKNYSHLLDGSGDIVEQQRKIMTETYEPTSANMGKGGPPNKLLIASPGSSDHQAGKAMDIDRVNVSEAQRTLNWIQSEMPTFIKFSSIIPEGSQNNLHIGVEYAVYPGEKNMRELLQKFYYGYESKPLYVSQSIENRISKLALLEKFKPYVEKLEKKYRGKSPDASDGKLVPKEVSAYLRINPNVKVNELILSAWLNLKPFLPDNLYMTSAVRTSEDQTRIINNYWAKVPQNYQKPGATIGEKLRILNNPPFNYKIAPPAYESKYGHLRGNAFDIGGAGIDVNEVARVVDAVSKSGKVPVKLNALPEPENNAVHITVHQATYDPSMIAKIFSLGRDVVSGEDHEFVKNAYESLIDSNASDDVIGEFEEMFGISKVAGIDINTLKENGDIRAPCALHEKCGRANNKLSLRNCGITKESSVLDFNWENRIKELPGFEKEIGDKLKIYIGKIRVSEDPGMRIMWQFINDPSYLHMASIDLFVDKEHKNINIFYIKDESPIKVLKKLKYFLEEKIYDITRDIIDQGKTDVVRDENKIINFPVSNIPQDSRKDYDAQIIEFPRKISSRTEIGSDQAKNIAVENPDVFLLDYVRNHPELRDVAVFNLAKKNSISYFTVFKLQDNEKYNDTSRIAIFDLLSKKPSIYFAQELYKNKNLKEFNRLAAYYTANIEPKFFLDVLLKVMPEYNEFNLIAEKKAEPRVKSAGMLEYPKKLHESINSWADVVYKDFQQQKHSGQKTKVRCEKFRIYSEDFKFYERFGPEVDALQAAGLYDHISVCFDPRPMYLAGYYLDNNAQPKIIVFYDEKLDYIKSTIRHELIHLSQGLLEAAISAQKTPQAGRGAGLPHYFDEAVAKKYKGVKSTKEDHATSDVEFYPNLINLFDLLKEFINTKWAMNDEEMNFILENMPEYMNDFGQIYVDKIPKDKKRALMRFRFSRFVGTNKLIDIFKKDPVRHNKLIRELYRLFDESLLKNAISARQLKSFGAIYGGWISPDSKFYEVGVEGHRRFIFDHPELFKDSVYDSPAKTINEFAALEDWIRVVVGSGVLSFDTPTPSDQYLLRIQGLLDRFPRRKYIELWWPGASETLLVPYSHFVAAYNFKGLQKMRAYASSIYGGWISPDGKFYEVSDQGHRDFVRKNPEFFGRVRTNRDNLYLAAMNKGWIRVHFSESLLNLEFIEKDDKYIRLAQNALNGLPQRPRVEIYIYNLGEFFLVPYSIFVASDGFRDIEAYSRRPKYSSANALNKIAKAPYGWWLSPEGTLYEVGPGEHLDFVINHTEIFGGNDLSSPYPHSPYPYRRAFDRGWIRIANGAGKTLSLHMPHDEDKYLKLIKNNIDKLPRHSDVIIEFEYNDEYFKVPYYILTSSDTFDDIRYYEKRFKSASISKRADYKKNIWISPSGETYDVRTHKSFVSDFADELFKGISEEEIKNSPFEFAYNNGWVRIGYYYPMIIAESNTENINRNFRKIQDIAASAHDYKNIYLCFSTNCADGAIELPRSTFISLNSLEDAIHEANKSKRLGKISKAEVQKIKLDEKEKKIFDLLNEVVDHYKLPSKIFVVGGWLRDKLMNKSSHDIDIMVDGGLSGREFAEKVVKYLRDVKGQETRSVGVVEAQPEKSKHLETAVIDLFGISVDVVSPRTEIYTQESRMPEIKPATPEQDSERRDFTLNSLFYDIQEGEVVDFTGKGLADLRAGVIRTPVDPNKTFMDDPLRLLRAIRFSAKYGFHLASDLIEAAKDPKTQEALRKKVSRERIEIEIRKILGGPNPVRAMNLIKELGLRSEVFKLPEAYTGWDMPQNNPHHDFNVWDHTLEVLSNLQEIIKDRDISESDKFVLNMASLLHDVGKLSPSVKKIKELEGKIIHQYPGHEEQSMKAAEQILRSLPGVKVEEIERIKKLIDGARRVNPQRCPTDKTCNLARKALGKFVREIGDDWEMAIDLGMADTAGHFKEQYPTHPRTYYETMKEQIKQMGPEQTQKMKPLLGGLELAELFDRKPGKWLGELNKELVDWQLENPEVTKDQLAEFAKKTYQEKGLDKIASISKRAGNMTRERAEKLAEFDPWLVVINSDIKKFFPEVVEESIKRIIDSKNDLASLLLDEDLRSKYPELIRSAAKKIYPTWFLENPWSKNVWPDLYNDAMDVIRPPSAKEYATRVGKSIYVHTGNFEELLDISKVDGEISVSPWEKAKSLYVFDAESPDIILAAVFVGTPSHLFEADVGSDFGVGGMRYTRMPSEKIKDLSSLDKVGEGWLNPSAPENKLIGFLVLGHAGHKEYPEYLKMANKLAELNSVSVISLYGDPKKLEDVRNRISVRLIDNISKRSAQELALYSDPQEEIQYWQKVIKYINENLQRETEPNRIKWLQRKRYDLMSKIQENKKSGPIYEWRDYDAETEALKQRLQKYKELLRGWKDGTLSAEDKQQVEEEAYNEMMPVEHYIMGEIYSAEEQIEEYSNPDNTEEAQSWKEYVQEHGPYSDNSAQAEATPPNPEPEEAYWTPQGEVRQYEEVYPRETEHKKLTSEHFMSISKRAKKHNAAGIFIVLPDKIAKQFPSLGKFDSSPSHITTLFIGKVKKDQYDLIENTIKGIVYDQEPFDVLLDNKPTYFPATKHSDGCKVAKMKVLSPELHRLHKRIKEALIEAGVEVDDHYPTYNPHVTLSYMEPPKEKWDGEVPSGSFKVKEIEIWGCGKNKVMPFKRSISKKAFNTKNNISKRSAIIDYPKKMYQEISSWATKTIDAKYHKITHAQTSDDIKKTIDSIKAPGDEPLVPTRFLQIQRDLMEIFKKIRDDANLSVSEEADPKEYTDGSYSQVNVYHADDKTINGVIYMTIPFLDHIAIGQRPYVNEETLDMPFSINKYDYSIAFYTISPKWIDGITAKALELSDKLNYSYNESFGIEDNYIKIGFPLIRDYKLSFKGILGGVYGFVSLLEKYSVFVEKMKILGEKLDKLGELMYTMRGLEEMEPPENFEVQEYMFFNIDVKDTEQYKKHRWFRVGLEMIKGQTDRLSVLFVNDESKKASADFSFGSMLMNIYNVNDEITEGASPYSIKNRVNDSIKHELVHMMQALMNEALSEMKGLEHGKYFAGIPSLYRREKLFLYGPSSDATEEEYRKQHAMSDIEFYSRITDEINYMKRYLSGYITGNESYDLNVKFNPSERITGYMFPKDLSPEIKQYILNKRFAEFIKTSETLKYFRQHDGDKFNKMVRELYREFEKVMKSGANNISKHMEVKHG